MSLSTLLLRAHSVLADQKTNIEQRMIVLFFSLSDGKDRAKIVRSKGGSFQQAWLDGSVLCQKVASQNKMDVYWLRVDWVTGVQTVSLEEIGNIWSTRKRDGLQYGVALDADFKQALIEPEINANITFESGVDAEAGNNIDGIYGYIKDCFYKTLPPGFCLNSSVWLFTHDTVLFEDKSIKTRDCDVIQLHNNFSKFDRILFGGCPIKNASVLVNGGESLLRKARRHLAGQRWQEAIVCAQKYVQENPNDTDGLLLYGHSLRKEYRFLESIEVLKKVVEIRPDNVSSWSLLAASLRRLGRYKTAISYYEHALSLDPLHWESLVGMSILLRRQGRLDESRLWAKKAVFSKPFFVRLNSKNSNPLIVYVIKCLGNLNFRERKAGYAIQGGHNTADSLVFDVALTRINIYVDAFELNAEWLKSIPKPDVLFNIMADADAIDAVTWKKAQALVNYFGVPVVNSPSAAQRTTRDGVFESIHDVPHVIMPRTLRMTVHESKELEQGIIDAGLHFPVIVRPTGTQTGQGLLYYHELDQLINRESHLEAGDYYVAEFYKFQSPDGYWRKSRLFYIGGEIVPEHHVAAESWNIHAANARELMARQDFIEEEIDFIINYEKHLGHRVLNAVHEIARRLGMDYFGIDCALLPDGCLLIFEINAAMQFMSASQKERDFLLKNRKTISEAFTRMVFEKSRA